MNLLGTCPKCGNGYVPETKRCIGCGAQMAETLDLFEPVGVIRRVSKPHGWRCPECGSGAWKGPGFRMCCDCDAAAGADEQAIDERGGCDAADPH